MDDIGATAGLGPPPPVPVGGGAEEMTAAAAVAVIGGTRRESPPPYLPPSAPGPAAATHTTLSDLTSTTMSNIAITSTGKRIQDSPSKDLKFFADAKKYHVGSNSLPSLCWTSATLPALTLCSDLDVPVNNRNWTRPLEVIYFYFCSRPGRCLGN